MSEAANKFVAEAYAHYQAKLAEGKERFGVLAISSTFIEHNAQVLVSLAEPLWQDLAKQSGLSFVVDYVADDPQMVLAIISREQVPYPQQLVELYLIVLDLKEHIDRSVAGDSVDLVDLLDSLEDYSGPYRLDVPVALFDNLFADFDEI